MKGLVAVFLILNHQIYCSSTDLFRTRQKEVVYAPHANFYKDTLLWTVQIKSQNSLHLTPLPVHSHDHHDDIYTFGNMYTESETETKTDRTLAQQIAKDCNLAFLGNVGQLKDIYLFGQLPESHNKSEMKLNNLHFIPDQHNTSLVEDIEWRLEQHDDVVWYHREKVFSRGKRSLHFNDPVYHQQWHLNNYIKDMDINVTGVWERNITGVGVTVAVVDDGLEWTNTDIAENYNAAGSYDLNSNDNNPMPNDGQDNNHHGTRCAGEIAAVANSYCAVGVAYRAKVSGIRILDGPMTDSLEAKGFNEKLQVNDIFSCSWGPDDDGKTVDGPHFLATKAIRYGIDFGRNGYGSIYVVASGNGGRFYDNCNYDGYANSIYTVTIGAVDETGHMPFYAEECASMLAVTFSSGMGTRSIVTTDWTKRGASGCTYQHSGTSAAAPIAAGMIALMLQARPCLTWRDVQYIIIMTAQKVDIDVAHWQRNKAGMYHSHKHGFGLMKAWRLVNAARVWEPVPWLTSYIHSSGEVNIQIPKGQNKPLKIIYKVTQSEIEGYDLFTLENAQLAVTLTHPARGDLQIVLICPSGMKSVVGAYRMYDRSSTGLTDWTFNTVRCWGESPIGNWVIEITDNGRNMNEFGYLKKWKLRLFGTAMSPNMFLERRRLIEEAMSGEYLNQNYTPPCWEPPNTAKPDTVMNEKALKIVILASAFLAVLAIYQTLEYIFCYNEEKKLMTRMKRVQARAEELTNNETNPSETTGLLTGAQDSARSDELWEEYPMQELSSSSVSEEQTSISDSERLYDLQVTLPPEMVHSSGHACSVHSNNGVLPSGSNSSENCSCDNSNTNFNEIRSINSDINLSPSASGRQLNDQGQKVTVLSPERNFNRELSSSGRNPTSAITSINSNNGNLPSDEEDVIFNQHYSSHSDEEQVHLIKSQSM